MPDSHIDPPPPDEADYRDQVLERFTARARSLTKQFTVLMIFAFGFLVFIIVPLAALNFDAAHGKAQKAKIESLTVLSEARAAEREAQEQKIGILRGNITSLNFVLEQNRERAKSLGGDKSRLETGLAENGEKRQEVRDQATSLKSAATGIAKTMSSFDAAQRVQELRNWFSGTAVGSSGDPNCEDTTRQIYLGCLVKNKLEADWDRDFSLIRREVVEPLDGIAPSVAGAIAEELSAVKETFGKRLEANQNFWQSVTGKELFMGGLSDDFSQAFGDIGKIVAQRLELVTRQSTLLEEEIAALARARQGLEDDIAVLDRELTEIKNQTDAKTRDLDGENSAFANTEIALTALADQILDLNRQIAALPDPVDIEAERKNIEARLNGLASPFGDIPIGLKEAVLVYPLILTAGFMVCTMMLSRLLALRHEFRSSMAREQALSDADVERRVAALAPLWFDASRAIWGNPTLVLALLLPLVLFVATGWLTLNDWLLPLGETASATNLRTFYAGLYGLGLAVFAAGLFRVWSVWTRSRMGTAPA